MCFAQQLIILKYWFVFPLTSLFKINEDLYFFFFFFSSNEKMVSKQFDFKRNCIPFHESFIGKQFSVYQKSCFA